MSQFSASQGSQSNQNAPGITVDLLALFYRLIDKRKLIVLTALLGTICMAVYSFVLAKPVYEATSKLYVLNSSDSAINLSDLQIGSYLTSDYQEIFTLWEVHEMVLTNLELDYTYDQLDDMVKVSNPSNTRMLDITVSSQNAQEAAAMANEYATVAQRYISDMMRTDAPSLVSQALVPEKPVSPRKTLNLVLGLFAGTMLSVCVLAAQFILDDKIKTAADVTRYLDVPTLAVIPVVNQFAPPRSEHSKTRTTKKKEGSAHA